MPFVAIFLGVALIAVGVQNTQTQFFTLLKGDVEGFFPWILAIGVIGALGYIKPIKPITDAFLVLVIVVLFLSNGGFFAKLLGTQATGTTQSQGSSSDSSLLGSLGSIGSLGGLSSLTGSSTGNDVALGASLASLA